MSSPFNTNIGGRGRPSNPKLTGKKPSKGLSKIRSIIENSASSFKNDIQKIKSMVSSEKSKAENEIAFNNSEIGKKANELRKIKSNEFESGDFDTIVKDIEKEFTPAVTPSVVEPVVVFKTQMEMSFFN